MFNFSTHLSSTWIFAWLLAVLFFWGVASAVAQQDPAGCTGSGLGIALFVDKVQAHVGDTLTYNALVYNSPYPACKNSEIRAWVVTPDGVTNQINLKRVVLNPGESDLYTGVATYVLRAQDIVGGMVKASAGDAAKIHQNETLSDGEAGQTVNTVVVNPCIEITAACDNGVGQDGLITFSGTVRNCGDINLSSVTVTNLVDGVGRLVYGPATLVVGQTATFSGSYKPANPCLPSSAVYVAVGTDALKQPKTVTATANSTCALSLAPGIAMSQACPAATVPGGGAFVYSGFVTNTGNVALANVVVVSDQPAPGTVIYSAASLAPKAVAGFTGRFTAPVNACSVTASLRVTGASPCGDSVSANTSSTCPLETRPALVVTQNCPATPAAPGGTLTYSGTVKNTGDVTLKEIAVSSASSGTVIFTQNTLEPGAVASFTGSLTTPLDACGVTNSLTASAKDVCQNRPVSAAVATVCALTTAPAVALAQNCPATAPPLGGSLTYSATIQNTGNITLLNLAVVSDRLNNAVVFTAASLPPGGTTNFTASYPVPANLNGCSITNTLKVTGADKCSGGLVSATVTTVCPVQSSPKIRIVANCPAAPVAPGATLTYNGTVSNVGDVTLTTISVSANQPAGGATVLSVNSLAPGASANFTGSYLAPLDVCASTMTLSVQAIEACAGSTVRDSVSQTCPLTAAPAVTVALACPATATAPGASLMFSGTIANTGNITLTNVVVAGNRPGPNTPVFGPVVLVPGARLAFTGSFVVPADVNSCGISSTVTVTGNSQCNGAQAAASASSVCPVATRPAVILTAACPPTATPQGGLLTFSGTVRNLGNIALTNVLVSVNRPTNDTPVIRIASLLPGQSTNFTGGFLVPVNCCEVVSTLAVIGYDLCGVTNVVDTATLICPVQFTPGVRISKVCPTETLLPGDEMKITGAVTNTGNITLTGVTVVSGLLGPGKPVLGPMDLAPGESAPYRLSLVVPADFCGVDTLVVTGQSLCDNPVTDSVTSTCPVRTTPGIVVLNLPAGVPVTCVQRVGRGSVANTGDVSLTDVWVYCNQPTNNAPVLGPITLAPGEVHEFSYGYTGLRDCNCCEISITLTAIGKGKCDSRQVAATSTLAVPIQTSPKLSVSLDCATAVTGGGLVIGTFQNTGDIALSNVVAMANLPVAGSVVAGPINLAPGESQLLAVDLLSTDPAVLQAFSVVVTGNSICGGEQVSARAACRTTPPGPLSIHRGPNKETVLSWPALAGVNYRVEYQQALSDSAWQALNEDMSVGTSDMTVNIQVMTTAESARFYRLRIVE